MVILKNWSIKNAKLVYFHYKIWKTSLLFFISCHEIFYEQLRLSRWDMGGAEHCAFDNSVSQECQHILCFNILKNSCIFCHLFQAKSPVHSCNANYLSTCHTVITSTCLWSHCRTITDMKLQLVWLIHIDNSSMKCKSKFNAQCWKM